MNLFTLFRTSVAAMSNPTSQPRLYTRRPVTVMARQILSLREVSEVMNFGHGDPVQIGDWLVESGGHRWIVEGDAFHKLYQEL